MNVQEEIRKCENGCCPQMWTTVYSHALEEVSCQLGVGWVSRWLYS